MSVQCNYNKCLKLVENLKTCIGKYRAIHQLNLHQEAKVLMKKTVTPARLAINPQLATKQGWIRR